MLRLFQRGIEHLEYLTNFFTERYAGDALFELALYVDESLDQHCRMLIEILESGDDQDADEDRLLELQDRYHRVSDTLGTVVRRDSRADYNAYVRMQPPLPNGAS